jgi:hypothetical protein
MSGFNFTAGLIILLLAFKSLNLAFRENQLFLGHLVLKGSQAILETGKAMPEPNTANPAGGYENTLFPQLVAGSDLAVVGLINGIGSDGGLGILIDTIFQIGLATAFADQLTSTPPSSTADLQR